MASFKMAIWPRRKLSPEDEIQRCASMRATEALAPLMEGPTPETFEYCGSRNRDGRWGSMKWVKGQILTKTNSMSRINPKADSYRRSDLRLLLGVLGVPLAPIAIPEAQPVPFLSAKNIPMETSSAQYIIQQYICAAGVANMNNVRNTYAKGRVKMLASEFETATQLVKTKNPTRAAESGDFVMWQMMPNMWNVEMEVGGSKVHAGSNGKLVWRHTPWLGSHAAKGPVRSLRRALQGLDPRAIANVFARAKCVGEKKVSGEDCFILKLAADGATLAARSDAGGATEIIRHVMLGYFSQRTGLLVQLEDSHLTKIQAAGGEAVFWETKLETQIDEYRAVETPAAAAGTAMVAHVGKTRATLFRFGEMALSHTKTRLEEEWVIEEVAFNVPGLSTDLFIPPADIRSPAPSTLHSPRGSAQCSPRGTPLYSPRVGAGFSHCKPHAGNYKVGDSFDNIIWRVEV